MCKRTIQKGCNGLATLENTIGYNSADFTDTEPKRGMIANETDEADFDETFKK